MTDVLTSALLYAMGGWRVAPVSPGSKVPSIKAWQDAATTNVDQVKEWWESPQHANDGVCIVTGKETGLWVLDVDVADGKQGRESLRHLLADNLATKMPETLVARTPSGGFHYFFKYPTDGREVRNNASSRLGPGLDVRGEGGQVNAAPTERNGKAYQWYEGRGPDAVYAVPAPAWLLDLVADEPKASKAPPCEDTDCPAAEISWSHAIEDCEGPLRPPLEGHIPAVLEVLSDNPAWVNAYNASHNWRDLLAEDGWTFAYTDRDDVDHWARPDKNPREGTSATVNYAGSDLLYVYTTSLPWLPPERAYDRYGYMVQRDYGGDFKAAADALAPKAVTTDAGVNLIDAPDAPANDEAQQSKFEQAEIPIASDAFWSATNSEDYLIEPFITAGRAHAMYAEAKAGKSYVALQAIAAATVPGHKSWTENPAAPITTLYLDYEMTDADLRERLQIFGYRQTDDWSHLHYVRASMLGADLDTEQGGIELLEQAKRWKCDLVVIDTMSRAVSGEENDSDTVRRFDRHTGRLLKGSGIAWLRIDHAGKNRERGQRGSSGKNDDVDVVWRLERTDNGALLKRTHTRVFWVPEEIQLVNVPVGETGTVVHERTGHRDYPSGTKEKAERWLALGIALDASRAQAQAAGLSFDVRHFTAIRRYAGELDQQRRNARFAETANQ